MPRGEKVAEIIFFLLIIFAFFSFQVNGCPNEESATKCCHEFFTTLRHLHWPSCQTFEYLDKCFGLTQCDMTELSIVCSNEYRKVHNKYIPKEAIMAVFENLRRRCTQYCQKNLRLENDCVREYEKLGERMELEQDSVLIRDLESLKRQLKSYASSGNGGRQSKSDLCKSMLIDLRKLHAHRRGVCEASTVYCLCRRLELDTSTRTACLNFKCDQFRYYDDAFGHGDGSKTFSRTQILLVIIFWIVARHLWY